MTAEIFEINVRTLEGWITKSEFKKKWQSLVSDLSFDNVLDVLPKSLGVKTLKNSIKSMNLNDKQKSLLLEMVHTAGFKIFSKNVWISHSQSHQAILAITKTKNNGKNKENNAIYVTTAQKCEW